MAIDFPLRTDRLDENETQHLLGLDQTTIRERLMLVGWFNLKGDHSDDLVVVTTNQSFIHVIRKIMNSHFSPAPQNTFHFIYVLKLGFYSNIYKMGNVTLSNMVQCSLLVVLFEEVTKKAKIE